jgi:hypothetical protein
MHTLTAFVLIGAVLATFFSAAAAFTGDHHEILDLKVHKPKNTIGSKGKLQLSLRLYDPDPLTNSSTNCHASWTLGQKVPTSYFICKDQSFGFRLKDFKGPQKFTIETQHSFEDPSVGDPPQDVVTTFARGYVNSTNTACRSGRKAINCHETNSPINLPIYAAIA